MLFIIILIKYMNNYDPDFATKINFKMSCLWIPLQNLKNLGNAIENDKIPLKKV